MSEKTVWENICSRMEGVPEWDGDRIENCNQAGMPDSIITYMHNGIKRVHFLELKDWSNRNKKVHPLLMEQFNFLTTYGGKVAIKVNKNSIHICPPDKVLTEGGARSVVRALEIGIEVHFNSVAFQENFMAALERKRGKLMHIRYDYLTAHDCGVKEHAQACMKKLGIAYTHSTPQSLGDQFWFWNCKNVHEPLPKYLTELKADPMECIGFGLSREEAIEIIYMGNQG